MRVGIVSLFPELFGAFLSSGLIARACQLGLLEVLVEPLREHGVGRHLSVDDTPYGGGPGMVLRVDCVVVAIEALELRLGARSHRVLLSPRGRVLSQSVAKELAREPAPLCLVCGRYEGFDERVASFVDAELSLGDFVLMGGEVPAMAVLEACARLLPGVLGNANSAQEESFSEAHAQLLEHPQYTRPREFRGLVVPEVLESGHHGRIEAWRREQSLARTRTTRPDLLDGEP